MADALKKALKSPLIHQGQLLQHSQNLIVHVAGGDTLTLAEVEGLMKQLGKHVPDQTQILFGISVDSKLGDSLALTLLSSLSAQQMACEIRPASAEPVADLPEELTPPISKARINTATGSKRPEESGVPAIAATNGQSSKARHEDVPPAATEESPEVIPAPVAARVKSNPAPKPARESDFAPAESVPAKPAPAAAPEPEESPPAVIKTSIFSVIDDESESEVEEAGSDSLHPASLVVPKPPARPRVQPRTAYAPPPAVESQDEESPAPGEPVTSSASKPALAAAGRPGPMLQPTLNFHTEEIARFKGTDKTIVEGEDLDVPTWMRVRQKTRS